MGSIPAAPTMNIILASASAGRKKILENLGLKFKVIPSNIDEEKITASSPILKLKKIARAKALAVISSLISKPYGLNPIVIAADSMVLFRANLYGKPKSRKEAKRLLTLLSGKTHEFISGLCVIDTNTNKLYQTYAKSRVALGKLTEKEISNYVKTASVTSYAGGYAPDLPGGEIIKSKMKIEGSRSNVLGGIPLEKLVPILRKTGIKL